MLKRGAVFLSIISAKWMDGFEAKTHRSAVFKELFFFKLVPYSFLVVAAAYLCGVGKLGTCVKAELCPAFASQFS
jgi:hypothetical protein